MKRTSPNVVYCGDVVWSHDGAWRVTSVHPEVKWVMHEPRPAPLPFPCSYCGSRERCVHDDQADAA